MEPLFLQSAYKDYLWGGDELKTRFHKQTSLAPLAESWELSCHPDGESTIQNGTFAGKALSEFLEAFPQAVCNDPERLERFPIMIKLIDARENLSVQVHPDNEYARKHENESGKTEMWYIIDCKPDAELIYGVERSISKETFTHAITDGTLMEFAHKVTVRPGDVFLIPAGTLHAIGKGILIAEVQQNSNSTYRVFDYGRVGKDGKQRELHIKKAIDVTDLQPVTAGAPARELVAGDGYEEELLVKCEYFLVKKLDIHSHYCGNLTKSSFVHLLVLDAEADASLEMDGVPYTISAGSSIFLPAGTAGYKVQGKCCCLQTSLL